MTAAPQEISKLLRAWGDGDQTAGDRLVSLVYDELRRMARRYMARQPAGHTLQTTALIHETYLRLVDQKELQWQNRAHFFGVAAKAMRSILVDYARKRKAHKREAASPLDAGWPEPGGKPVPMEEILAVDEGLQRLSELDPQQCRVVEMRYFAGMSVEETAEALGISPRTVKRDWAMARSWLHAYLRGEGSS